MLLTNATPDIFEHRLQMLDIYRNSTVSYYKHAVSVFSRYCTSRGILVINESVRNEYFTYLDKIYPKGTALSRKSVISCFYSVMGIATNKRTTKKYRKTTQVLKRDDFLNAVEMCAQSCNPLRDALLLEIPYYESLTTDQLLLLRKRDFFKRGTDMFVRIKPYKGRGERTKLILDHQLEKDLELYLHARISNAPLFSLSSRRVREIYRGYGVTSSALLYSCLKNQLEGL